MNLRIILHSFNCSDVLSRRVRILQDYLSKLKISHGIVTADDGSNEGGKAQRLVKVLGCVYVANPANMGKGEAQRVGMSKALGIFRICTDPDVPYEFEAIERIVGIRPQGIPFCSV